MIVQPYHLYVERIEPERNMARFYALSVQPTLFGEVSLVRCWGRIGSRGQKMVHVFNEEKHAVGLFLELLRKKRNRGYRPKRVVEIQHSQHFQHSLPQQRNDKDPAR
ncbi:MAG: WGR domain-containing protein [Allorhizobium sp.]